MKVLIVDDSRAMRMIVRRTLRQAGFDCDVHEADNGKTGLAAADEHSPNLILSDWNMPEMTGIEFLEALNEQGSRIPFGFVTSEGTTAMRARAAAAGARFLVAKPFTPDAFKKALDGALA